MNTITRIGDDLRIANLLFFLLGHSERGVFDHRNSATRVERCYSGTKSENIACRGESILAIVET